MTRVVHGLGRPTCWVGSGRGSKKFSFFKRIVYHVCNLCQTERFVDLQFDSGILLTIVVFADWCLSDSHGVSVK